MIQIENVVKQYTVDGRKKKVLDGISFEVARGERIALLGTNGSGKSTLIRLLARVELPTSGSITQNMSVSWPIGFHTGVQGSLSGFDNIRFVARIYNEPYEKLRDYVEEFSELGSSLKMPVKTYSSGMMARLAFGLSLAIDFDCYLIDEILAVGDYRFHQKCVERLLGPRSKGGFILATHIVELAQQYCSRALVMQHGRVKTFDLQTGLEVYRAL